jgi:hypothetical protein
VAQLSAGVQNGLAEKLVFCCFNLGIHMVLVPGGAWQQTLGYSDLE